MESDLVSQVRSDLSDYLKAKTFRQHSLSPSNSLMTQDNKVNKKKLFTPKNSKPGKKKLFLVKKSKPEFLLHDQINDKQRSISFDKTEVSQGSKPKAISSLQQEAINDFHTGYTLSDVISLKVELFNQEKEIKALRTELESYKNYKSLADSLQVELITAKEVLKRYENTFGTLNKKSLESSNSKNNLKSEEQEIRHIPTRPKSYKIIIQDSENIKEKNQEPQSSEKKHGILSLLMKKITEDFSMRKENYDLEIKSLQEQCHKYKVLYEIETLKTSKLQNDINFLKEELKFFASLTDNPNSMQMLQNKNIEYISSCLKNADSVFEKTIEIKALHEQKDKILKELLKKQEDAKEIPSLRQHVTTLLELLRNLRSDLKKVAQEHINYENEQGTQAKNSIVEKISKIADSSKMDLIDSMKFMLTGVLTSKKNNIT